jgi:hypothetical protein
MEQSQTANKDEIRARQKKYEAANKDKIRDQKKKYYFAHKDEIARHYAANKDEIQAKRKGYPKKYYLANKDKIAEYRTANKDKIRDRKKKWYLATKDRNKDKIRDRKKKYYLATKDRRYTANKDKILTRQRKYQNDRRKTDINYKLSGNLRVRLHCALKGNFKTGSAIRDLGCSIEDLKIHLQSKFIEGMSWENYGEWHIDHIIPLSSAQSPEQMIILCHFSNLQPLWAADNLAKSDKIQCEIRFPEIPSVI